MEMIRIFRNKKGKRDGGVHVSIPCLFHNLTGFDSHLLLSAVKPQHVVGGRLNCIARNSEKYVTISIGLVDYRDSLQFTLKSLENLVSLLKPEVNMIINAFLNDHTMF